MNGLKDTFALLIIDMQNDFVLDNAPLKVQGVKEIIQNILEVIAVCRAVKIPVFHVVRVHRSDGSDVEIIRAELFRKNPFAVLGTHGAAIIDEITPSPRDYIITKTRMSAFIGTELDLMLKTLKVTTVIVTGIQTPNCIRTTVFDAIAYNYNVILVRDAVKAQTPEIHEANVKDMQNIGVRIIDTASLSPELQKGH